MPDDVIRVSTVVDLTGLTTGMPNAAAVVESSAARMNAAFGQVVSSTAQLDTKLQTTAASLGKEAAASRDAQVQIDALQQQVAALTAQLTVLETKLAAAPRRASGEFTQARHAIMGVGEEIGVRMPRFITTFLSHLSGVAPVMAAAFSIVAIVGIIEIIPRLIDKLFEVTAALGGWDEAAKKAYDDLLAANNQMYLASFKNAEEMRKLSETGTTGLMKLSREHENNAASAKDYNAALVQAQHEIQKLSAEKEKLKDKGAPAIDPINITAQWTAKSLVDLATGRAEKEKQITKELETQNKNSEEFVRHIKELQLGDSKVGVEIKVTGAEQSVAQMRAFGDAVKTVSMASLSFQEQSARQMYEAGLITHEQEIAALKSTEEQKFEVEKASIAKRKALAVTEEKQTGKSAGPELTVLEAQREALEITHQAKMSAIVTTGEDERRRADDAAALATVAGAKRVADAKVQLEEATTRELRASRKTSLDEEAAALSAAENERWAADKAAIQKQIEIAKEYPEKNRAQIITLNSDLEAAEISHQAKLQAIDAAASTQRLEDNRRRTAEEIGYAQESANIQLQTTKANVDAMLKEHRIGTTQWTAMQRAALNTWYSDQRMALEKELSEAEKVYGERAIEYKKLLDKMKSLDQQYEKDTEGILNKEHEKWSNFINSTENQINSGFGRALAGYESFTKAWSSLSEQMMTKAAENILKMIEQEIMYGESQVLNAAKIAAANTYKVISAIPVVGPFLAPPAAAAAFAAVMAFGSFQQGGVTETETMAHLHPKEMVLPEPISTPLIRMLSSFSGGIMAPSGMVALYGGSGVKGGGSSLAEQVTSLGRSIGRAAQAGDAGGQSGVSTSLAISLQAWDGDSVDRWFRNGGDSLIANAVNRGVRQGRISLSKFAVGR